MTVKADCSPQFVRCCADAILHPRRIPQQRHARRKRRLSAAAVHRSRSREEAGIDAAGNRSPLPGLRRQREDPRHDLGRRDRRPPRACGVGRRARPRLERKRHAGDGVPHCVDDQKLHRARDSQAARRRQAVFRRSGVEMDPRIRAHGAADARYAAIDRQAADEPQRRLPRRQPVGRPATECNRRGARLVAARRHSLLDAARHALRIFQLRLRTPRTHRLESLRRGLRALHARSDFRAVEDDGDDVRVLGSSRVEPRHRVSIEAGWHLRRRAAAASRCVRRDGRFADHRQRHGQICRLPPVGVAAARRCGGVAR